MKRIEVLVDLVKIWLIGMAGFSLGSYIREASTRPDICKCGVACECADPSEKERWHD